MPYKVDEQIAAVLEANGWSDASREPIKSDASSRRYTRLRKNGETAILMDARKIIQEQTVQFCNVARILRYHGFSAPKIYAKNNVFSLLLVEDFGDALFARLMLKQPELEEPLYRIAIDMLLRLRSLLPSKEISVVSTQNLQKMLEPFFDTYMPEESGMQPKKKLILEKLYCHLAELDCSLKTIGLRDCHSENLVFLSDRAGIKKVGLLDFQDAFLCHPAYDLVSLLQDARRDLSKNLEYRMIAYYLSRSKDEEISFMRAYRFLGLVRNLRILGVFVNLFHNEGKIFYASLIPRVRSYIEVTLRDPSFDQMRYDILSTLRTS